MRSRSLGKRPRSRDDVSKMILGAAGDNDPSASEARDRGGIIPLQGGGIIQESLIIPLETGGFIGIGRGVRGASRS